MKRPLAPFLAVLLAAILTAAPVLADPWVGPGDARLRTDVELLQAHGYLQGPIDAWPLPWAQIDRGVERARADPALPLHLLTALRRIEALSALASAGTHFEVRASATNEAALVRTFDRVARNRGEVSALASHDLGNLHVSWGGSWQSSGNGGRPATQHGNGFAPDGSHVALEVVDNWLLYGGWVDHWWGAGQDGAMLFSTSARPMPQIGFRRLEPFNIDFPVLRWLGPVTFEAFAAQAREKRDFDNPYMLGMRLAFQPARHFEIGFNRGLQLCGKGRPCGLKTITHALIGFGDFDNTGTADEPGNQLAGFDLSWRQPVAGNQVLKLSFATVAEDEAKVLIEQFARQAGIGVAGPVGRSGAMHDSGVEYVDTQAAKVLGWLIGGDTWPGSIYNHFLYTDGWTFGRRPLGHSIDGDARMWTLHTALTDAANRRWNLAARHILLNLHDYDRYRVSQTRERILQLEGGVNWPTMFGDIKATARLQKNAPNTRNRDPLLLQTELGWTSRF